MFSKFDIDKSGSIDAAEFQMLVEACGEEMDEDELNAVLMGLDKNQSGEIDRDEFTKWLNGYDGQKTNDFDGRALAANLRARLAKKMEEGTVVSTNQDENYS